MRIALQRVRLGRPAKSILMVGLRGVGKTVLLDRMRDDAVRLVYRLCVLKRLRVVLYRLFWRRPYVGQCCVYPVTIELQIWLGVHLGA